MAERPIGVTIIAILFYLIAGILLILGGALLLAASAMIAAYLAMFGGLVALLGGAIGAVVLIVGIIYLLVFYGLWKLKKWGLYIALILQIIGIIGNIASIPYAIDVTSQALSVIMVIIYAIITWYLWKSKAVFK